MAVFRSLLGLAGVIGAAAAGAKCPGSAAMVHASCSVEAEAKASCADVKAEMLKRVAGQDGTWYDPHNKGTYSLLEQGEGELLFERKSGRKSFGGKIYTDKVLFTFKETAEGCDLGGCSESQGTSVGDFSTNYCNMRNLYCGKADGCSPVEHDFATEETTVKPSIGASKDPKACIVAAAIAEPKPSEEPCCKTCKPPSVKYFSTDAAHGFCGEACIEPKRFDLFHKFEANLTLAKDDKPCSEQYTPTNKDRFTDYFQTVTHGDPFGLISVTLDLYAPGSMPDHSCCDTPLFQQLHCNGIPGLPTVLAIKGTGPFCCPKGATEATPCPKTTETEFLV